MSRYLIDEMKENLKQTYETSFGRKYRSVHMLAVECQRGELEEKELIRRIEAKRNQLLGELEIISVMLFDNETLPEEDKQWLDTQQDKAFCTIRSSYLFGICMGEDGEVYGGNDKGELKIRDKKAWEEAAYRISVQRKEYDN